MPNLDEVDNIHIKSPQKVLLYGPPKSGKTELYGKLAEFYKLIVFDLESSSDTLLKLPSEFKKNIQLIKVMDTMEFPRAHMTVDKVTNGGDFSICWNHGLVDCAACKKLDNQKWDLVHIPKIVNSEELNTIIVFDSGSQLTISINATVVMGKEQDYKEQLDDWGAIRKFCNRIFSRIQNGPYNCIVTAHETLAKREDGSTRICPSIGSDTYAITVAKFFGHVIYMDKMNCKHRAWSDTLYSNNVITGSRLDVQIENLPLMSLKSIFSGEIEPRKVTQSMNENKIEAKRVIDNLDVSNKPSNTNETKLTSLNSLLNLKT